MLHIRPSSRIAHIIPAIVAAALLALLPAIDSGSGAVFAQQSGCPSGAAGCMIVNSNLDTDLRDSRLTLREALLVDRGDLIPANMTTAERQQLIANESGAWDQGKARNIYFDPAIFCDGCGSNTIILSPPGWGGDGPTPVALPPGFGGDGPTPSSPPGWGGEGPARVGMSYNATMMVEQSATVVLDGSLLPTDMAGIAVTNGSAWLRGMTLQNFGGIALLIAPDLAGGTTVGSNNDGLNDALEEVKFMNNGTNIYVGE